MSAELAAYVRRLEDRAARLKKELDQTVTLRDQFAMAALAGMLSDHTRDMYVNDCAESAYKYADAMMEKRK